MGGSVEAMVDAMIKAENVNGAKGPKRPEGVCPSCWAAYLGLLRRNAGSDNPECTTSAAAHVLAAFEYFDGKAEREKHLSRTVEAKAQTEKWWGEAKAENRQLFDDNTKLVKERNQLKADRERDAVEFRRLKDALAAAGGEGAGSETVPAVNLIDLVHLAQQAEDSGDGKLASDLYEAVSGVSDRRAENIR